MSDEEDYMSDVFLMKMSDPKSIPKQSNDLKRKKSDYTPPMKLSKLEQINRSEGLEKKISSDNKGYNMLIKMGYKPGKGLGKDETGRVEPVPVDLKNDKGGLGGKTVLNEKVKLNKLVYEVIRKNYRKNMSKQYEEKAAIHNLYKIQRICRDLDLGRELKVPLKCWYWPDIKEKKSNYDDEIDEYYELEHCDISDEEKLLHINEYLRKMFSYCFWCGSCYSDNDDLSSNCPGKLKEDHE